MLVFQTGVVGSLPTERIMDKKLKVNSVLVLLDSYFYKTKLDIIQICYKKAFPLKSDMIFRQMSSFLDFYEKVLISEKK
jgi:hypothetical protein